MKYFIMTYGCQYNEWDAARINYMLKNMGLVESLEKNADIIFVVSCSVRKSAVDRLLGKIKNWNDQGKKIFVSGCVLDNDKPKFVKKNVIFWYSDKPEELINSLLPEKQFNNKTTRLPARQVQQFASEGSFETSYLPIMLGCNNFCSYCAVPYTRGRERSRPEKDVVNDFKKMIDKGAKEITLLGQNVNSYEFGFAKLLKKLNDVPGSFIISFTSNHPKDMTNDVIESIKILPKVKKEIHLPLQSGSNKVLKAMNRPYTKEQYLGLVDKIRKEIPEIKITTDVIVGFPGETKNDFTETVEVFKKINFTQAFINKYSPRSGTAAFKLGDPIPWSEKERRWRILNKIANIEPKTHKTTKIETEIETEIEIKK